MSTFRFKTDLNCNACVAVVKPHLDNEPSISRWEVDLDAPEKTLTVEGRSDSADKVKAAVEKAGFHAMDEMPDMTDRTDDAATTESPGRTTYCPLLLLTGFLVGLVLLLEVRAGHFVWARAMQNFMGVFFGTFAFLKLLDLRGFADRP